MPALKIHNLNSLHDRYLLPWLDLYETAFPANEKVLVSDHLKVLRLKEQGLAEEHLLLAAVNESEVLVGLARLQLLAEKQAAILWYLAIQPGLRSQGTGAAFYQEILGRIDPLRFKILIHEVEIPEDQPNPQHQALAARRIEFYRRQGARRLGGIRYLQYVGDHQPLTPMHILVYLFQPIQAQSAFNLVQQIAGNLLTQTGSLEFDPVPGN